MTPNQSIEFNMSPLLEEYAGIYVGEGKPRLPQITTVNDTVIRGDAGVSERVFVMNDVYIFMSSFLAIFLACALSIRVESGERVTEDEGPRRATWIWTRRTLPGPTSEPSRESYRACDRSTTGRTSSHPSPRQWTDRRIRGPVHPSFVVTQGERRGT